jgi:two-component system, chemotaxis family, CheB/CheR fusion protein
VNEPSTASAPDDGHDQGPGVEPAPVLGSPMPCPVVGIGMSAGGLEALEPFLAGVPNGTGMAWVVIQHLDPNHEGQLVALLQRMSTIPVEEVTDGRAVEPDRVYVIPKGHDMAVSHGRFQLLPITRTRGLHLPIDFFLRTLAEDLQSRAIGVILSGMGSDGTIGLRAVKEKGGAVFVQSPTSAKFDSMPRSAIDDGLADVVAPVEELPRRILAYRQHAPHLGSETIAGETGGILENVIVLLRMHTGTDFSPYKRSTLHRRMERRMGLHQISNPTQYVRFLREDPNELDVLFKELLIGVTSFFRDPPAWKALTETVLPDLVANHERDEPLRAWVAGCSTGEEAYSLAMAFEEATATMEPRRKVSLQIFATDLDRHAIDRARAGHYSETIESEVSPERLRRFFVRDQRGYRVSKNIREMVVFAPQNLIVDPPFTRLDFFSCRNLLIYFSGELQRTLVPLFHYTLVPGGILFLGSAETIGASTSLFAPVDAKNRIYRRLGSSSLSDTRPIPLANRSTPRGRDNGDAPPDELSISPANVAPGKIQTLVDRLIVQRFAPICVLCSEQGDVIYLSARAGKYLEPAVGRANLNLFSMVREGLRFELSRTFSKAVREDRAVARRVAVGTDGGTQRVTLTVERLKQPKPLEGTVMVVISEEETAVQSRARPKSLSETRRVSEIRAELERAQEEIQTTREEMQTSQEELRSSNEELQSTNEELQSTNEELTTSKEEMQSLNEELETVNHELSAKVDELSRANNDAKNLLDSTDIATLFLDTNLRVRRFTSPTTRIINLIRGDVGRPITDISTDLVVPELEADAASVLRSLVPVEKTVSTRSGSTYLVRIMPYRTLDNVIDGVVITFMDASASRALETTLRQQTNQLRQMAEALPTLILGFRPEGPCDLLSRQWVDYTGIAANEQTGSRWMEQVHPDDRSALQVAWLSAIETGNPCELDLRVRAADGLYRWFHSRFTPILESDGRVLRWYATITNIEPQKRAEADATRLGAILEEIPQGIAMADGRRRVSRVNRAAMELLGRTREALEGQELAALFPSEWALDERINDALEQERTGTFEGELNAVRVRVRVVHVRGSEVTLFLEPSDRKP